MKISQVEQATTDDIEGVLAAEATNPKSFLDRMAYLRAHRPELYDRAKRIKIEGGEISREDAARRLGVVENIIDGEISQNYLRRKHKQQQLNGSDGTAGSSGTGQQAGGGSVA